MQQLKFEEAWDKTIAPQDREVIIRQFNEHEASGNLFIPIREALNHRGDLLVTVIVQNTSDTMTVWEENVVSYVENGVVVAEHLFSIDRLTLAPKTSMPWTLIFPQATIKRNPQLNGELQLKRK